ncbi:MAG TPA: ATP-binding protein [Candidatus Bacteroides pullicola]|uniref:histidine kinase n=1 Tax=Candidatus Bacteroides pullicola TaxID=2838475 RepID=A0A9D1ZKQ4_9BACE|nr:ATP-binding protein [Candidatus Bacteroides pullicola]
MNRPFIRYTSLLVLISLAAGYAWTLTALGLSFPLGNSHPLPWAVVLTLCLAFPAWQLHRLLHRHARKVLFLLDAIENNDYAVHFPEEMPDAESNLVNRALNRIAHILYKVKSETVQQEKYYELILECVNTGIIVLNDNGAVYQKNSEALRLLGLSVFTHVRQLDHIDPKLTERFSACRTGDSFQFPLSNERGSLNLFVRVSDITIHDEHLRILTLNDINNELDEKEIDSWMSLTRVLTHEIMNNVTPITSLSDTLLTLTAQGAPQEEIRNGLKTISQTGKGLLAFVESYRKFTHIPTPVPTLFYVKGFLQRMMELARHQYPDAPIQFKCEVSPDDLILHADENLIGQVVTNLLKNAIQAIESDSTRGDTEGHITLHAYCDESEAVVIEVSNDGPAIPPEIAEHIFIPFFTTRTGGSGIGLSISRQIMRLSNGSIALLPGEPTTFILKFE